MLMSGCFSHTPTGDLAHNSGMCPDWELNCQSFGSKADTQSTEPHQPGVKNMLIIIDISKFSNTVPDI